MPHVGFMVSNVARTAHLNLRRCNQGGVVMKSPLRGSDTSRRYRRIAAVAVAGSVLAETAIFVIWGLILYPEGSILAKFLWTIVFCGIGMGSVVAVALILFVVDRLDGWPAVAATSAITALVLGGVCNMLCFQLDSHFFHYFGGAENPTLFIVNGFVMAALGGALGGWLLFTPRGQRHLDRLTPK